MKQAQSVIPHIIDQHAEEAPETLNGLVSAFGWVAPHHLQGKVNGLLVSKIPLWRQVGIAACAIHRVDPGQFLDQAIQDDDTQLRVRALKAAGELGRVDRWWKQHQHNFLPGVRYLLGKPVNKQQCQIILKTGKQRQRQTAALELSLMQPATPLFETRAMGKRQQKLLS